MSEKTPTEQGTYTTSEKTEIPRKRISVLFSGRGTNMASLIMASMAPDYPAIITHAITNVPDAGGLEIAKFHNIPSTVIDHKDFASRHDHEEAVLEALKIHEPDFICLAGYMRILTPEFVKKYRGKILNIHPSLLPSFKGVDTHHRALLEGVKIHGASVHFVDETLDGGQIIAQAAVRVEAGDDEESLSARVLGAEHLLYPKALKMVASGDVRLSGSRMVAVNQEENANEDRLFSPALGALKHLDMDA